MTRLQRHHRYDDFAEHREDMVGQAATDGARLFLYHRDLIAPSGLHGAFRSREIDVPVVHDSNRVIAFRRWDETS